MLAAMAQAAAHIAYGSTLALPIAPGFPSHPTQENSNRGPYDYIEPELRRILRSGPRSSGNADPAKATVRGAFHKSIDRQDGASYEAEAPKHN
jgi:hypothetical protein